MIQGIFLDAGVLESPGNPAPHAFVPERISESRVSPPKSGESSWRIKGPSKYGSKFGLGTLSGVYKQF